MITFPISGVETFWWLPSLVSVFVSTLAATGGLSGAFVLLPFQVSILHFTDPAVSPTNLLFNIIAIPLGVWRFQRERRIVWPLAMLIVIGAIPGLLAGVFLRIRYLPDPHAFKFFVGLVLAYMAVRLADSLWTDIRGRKPVRPPSGDLQVTDTRLGWNRLSYRFYGDDHSVPTVAILILSAVVGVIGGIYGIGGGAIIAPFLISVFRLPVYTIAGAALLSTFATSVVGVVLYVFVGPLVSGTGLPVSPDWHLGLLLGLGGAVGIYLGARLQRYLPAAIIKAILIAGLLFISVRYITQFVA
jgi:hypothetical protein